MKFIPRLKIRGKKATAEQIESEIMALIYGNGNRPYPIPTSEIAKILGISRTTIYYYLNRLKEQANYQKKILEDLIFQSHLNTYFDSSTRIIQLLANH